MTPKARTSHGSGAAGDRRPAAHGGRRDAASDVLDDLECCSRADGVVGSTARLVII
ncbi:hypothetical protein [Rhodoplanes azumiensis]|uniref:Uncharacterized protein n=1 Tax=Rhodoplanes azumiensis TaxID=1897628 RepID=A0ABW5AKI0_9BRAD